MQIWKLLLTIRGLRLKIWRKSTKWLIHDFVLNTPAKTMSRLHDRVSQMSWQTKYKTFKSNNTNYCHIILILVMGWWILMHQPTHQSTLQPPHQLPYIHFQLIIQHKLSYLSTWCHHIQTQSLLSTIEKSSLSQQILHIQKPLLSLVTRLWTPVTIPSERGFERYQNLNENCLVIEGKIVVYSKLLCLPFFIEWFFIWWSIGNFFWKGEYVHRFRRNELLTRGYKK